MVGIQAKNPAIVGLRSRRAVRNALPVERQPIDWGAGALEYAKGVSAADVRNGSDLCFAKARARPGTGCSLSVEGSTSENLESWLGLVYLTKF